MSLADKVVYLYERGLRVWEIAMALRVEPRTVERLLGRWRAAQRQERLAPKPTRDGATR